MEMLIVFSQMPRLLVVLQLQIRFARVLHLFVNSFQDDSLDSMRYFEFSFEQVVSSHGPPYH